MKQNLFRRVLSYFLKSAGFAFYLFVFACSSFPLRKSHWVLRSSWVHAPSNKALVAARKFHKIKPVYARDESLGRELILYTSPSHGVLAVDRWTGQKVWQYAGAFGGEVGVSVAGDMVFYPATDGNIYALQLSTGKLIWSFPTRSENLAPLTVTKGIVLAVTSQNVVYALEALSGRLVWLYARGDSVFFSVRGQAAALNSGDRVFAAFSDGSVVALDFKSGKLLWEQILVKKARFLDLDWMMLLQGSQLLVGSVEDQLYVLNAQTGLIESIYPLSSYYEPTQKDQELLLTIYPKNLARGSLEKTQIKEWKTLPLQFSSLPNQGIFLGPFILVGETQGALRLNSAQNNTLVADYFPGRGVMGPILALPLNAPNAQKWELYFVSSEYYLHKLSLQQER